MTEREYVTYSNENGGECEVHRVTKDTAGRVQVIGGGTRTVSEGDVLVRTSNPYYHDVYPEKAFNEMFPQEGSAKDSQQKAPVEYPGLADYDTDDEDDEDVFEPVDHSAAEVRRYLRGLDRDEPDQEEEYQRVVAAEQAGKNRSSAFPAG